MTARPQRTTTLAGPNRVIVGVATAGLVALASAGTALLVLTGTSAVAPSAAPVPPLPSTAPLTRAPGVVVLPSEDAGRLAGGSGPGGRDRGRRPPQRTPSQDLTARGQGTALPFVVAVDVTPASPESAAVRAGSASVPARVMGRRPGRGLANGPGKHGKRAKPPARAGNRGDPGNWGDPRDGDEPRGHDRAGDRDEGAQDEAENREDGDQGDAGDRSKAVKRNKRSARAAGSHSDHSGNR